MSIDDLNLAVLCGRLATEPEIAIHDSGSRKLMLLVTVAARRPRRRIDVVPVTLYDPPDDLIDDLPGPNTRVWVAGAVQRRAQDGPEGRRNRIEIVADQVAILKESRVMLADTGS